MKILYGMQPPDEGTMSVDGEPGRVPLARRTPSPPASAWSTSTSCWPTTSRSSRTSSSATSPPGSGASTSRTPGSASRSSSSAYGLDVDPDQTVETLGVGERQRVEILKVLFRGARILILDEPTAVLVPQEVEELFDNLRELKAEGETIMFISHKLDEVLSIADAITVLRAGTDRGHRRPERRHRRRPGRADGRQRAARRPRPASPPSPTRSSSRSTTSRSQGEGDRLLLERHRLQDPPGRGGRHRRRGGQRPDRAHRRRSSACNPPATGAIRLGGEDIAARRRPGTAVKPGIGYIPEDRHRQRAAA